MMMISDDYQKFSQSRISETPQARFESTENWDQVLLNEIVQ